MKIGLIVQILNKLFFLRKQRKIALQKFCCQYFNPYICIRKQNKIRTKKLKNIKQVKRR